MSSMLALLCLGWFSFAAAWSVHKPAPYALEDADLHFEHFIQEFERNYSNEREKQSRFQIFKANLVKINSLNERSQDAVYGITQFSDLSHEELKSRLSCLEASLNHDSDFISNCTYLYDKDINYNDAPESWDWREHDVITPVKDQGKCGSCYAFSAIGNVEGQFAIKHKELVRLSEQQILDCDKSDKGCGGGIMSHAMRSLIEQGGSMGEADYPYNAKEDKICHFDANKVKTHLTDCRSYNLTSQEKLKQLLYHNGPIAIAINADNLDPYTNGIIDDDMCDGGLDHGVLLVGYGSENDVPYWIVKNSWGKSWGENGYFRMHRGEKFHSCHMLNKFMASAIVA